MRSRYFLYIAAVATVSAGIVAGESALADKEPRNFPGAIDIAALESKETGKFQITASGKQVDMQIVISLELDDLPQEVTWELTCIEPGPGMMGEETRILASDVAAVSPDGLFELSAGFQRDSFFDCYVYADGPAVAAHWVTDQGRGVSRDTFFGDMVRDIVRIAAISNRPSVAIKGFDTDEFPIRKRWRRLYVELDHWGPGLGWDELSTVGIEQVRLDIRKELSLDESQQNSFDLTHDTSLFAYYGTWNTDFLEYQYQLFLGLADGRVIPASADWIDTDNLIIPIVVPVTHHRIEVDWFDRPDFANKDIEIDIACPRFGETTVTIGTIPPTSDGFLELSCFCDPDEEILYRIISAESAASKVHTEWQVLDDTYLFLGEKFWRSTSTDGSPHVQ